jgi:hypothetical protein
LSSAELKAVAQRSYTNAALQHVFTGNLLAVIGAVMIAGYVEDVPVLDHWPLLAIAALMIASCVAEEIVGVRQAIQVGAYFRTEYDREAAALQEPKPSNE